MIGKSISYCRIIEKTGAGGIGVVYRAPDEHLARDVAVKVLPPGRLIDESACRRFHKETLFLSKLKRIESLRLYNALASQAIS